MKISEPYRMQQEILHATTDYGTASQHYAPLVNQIVNKLGVTEVLDYGSGRGKIRPFLKFDHKVKLQFYDPGVPEFAEDPIPMQMCICLDVLEHIEPEYLEAVLDDLKRVTGTVGLFTISTRPAQKMLADGRNAHLIQEPMEWWLPKIWERFDIQTVQIVPDEGFYVIVYAKPEQIEVPQIEVAH